MSDKFGETKEIRTIKSADPGYPSGQKNTKKRVLTPEEKARRRAQRENRRKWENRINKISKGIKIIFGILVFCFLVGGTAAGIWVMGQLRDVPELDVEGIKTYSSPSTIYDQNDEYIMSYGGNENVSIARIDEIPENLKNAFIAIEDHKFYSHHGIDLKRLIGAVLGQLTGKGDYGGSTITQQLIKRTHLTSERTYKRKIQEIYLAIRLERKMSKDEILEAYLNNIFMGGTVYGIKNAAKNYFGVDDLNDLTLRQCAALAGVVQSPNVYSPRIGYETGDMRACNDRTDTVLWTMKKEGMITEAEYNDALKAPLYVVEEVPQTAGTFYNDEYWANAYFIDYAITDIANQMFEEEFPGCDPSEYDLEMQKTKLKNGGYKIYLTLDRSMQKTVQDSLSNFNSYPVVSQGKRAEASAVVIENSTGEIKALVGGRDIQDTIDGFNRATDSTQAVGSAIKPLSVYAPALELGAFPGTTVKDIKEAIPGYGNSTDGFPPGDTIDGMITMRRAVETSHNVAAARFFLEKVGLTSALDFLEKEGFNKNHLSLTTAGLALGATDVTTLEMTGGYACLANGGLYIKPHTYRIVLDSRGNTIVSDENVKKEQVFSESTAWLMTSMLESNMTNGLGGNAKLYNVKSCGKTGTHEHKVVSFGGYTHWYSSFLRISTDDYGDFANSSSYYQSSPLWRSYMDPIHAGLDKNQSIQTKSAEELGIKQYWVCNNSGMLAKQECTDEGLGYMEWAAESNKPVAYCDHHEWFETESENWWENVPEDAVWDPAGNGWWDHDGGWHGNGYWDEWGWHDPAWDINWEEILQQEEQAATQQTQQPPAPQPEATENPAPAENQGEPQPEAQEEAQETTGEEG